MAKTYNKMQIDMNGDILSSVTAVEKDTLSRYLDCYLYNNGVPLDLTGHMAQLYVTKPKPDNTLVVTQGEITDAAAGRVQFELTNQTLAVTGWLDLQIVLTSGEGEVLSSEIFKLHVLPSIRSDEAIESTNEFGALVVLFQEIQNSLDLMKAIVEAFGVPGDIAEEYGVTTFWGMIEVLAKNADAVAALKAYVNSTMGTNYFMTINKMISSLSGTADFIPLDLLIKSLIGGTETFTTDGTFIVPDGVTKIKVIAAGGGGGGGCQLTQVAAGGGGGACIVGIYTVIPGQKINIVIGVGGKGGNYQKNDTTEGSDGGATIVGDLVTAPGGGGAKRDGGNDAEVGGIAGGTGGGKGASVSYASGGNIYDEKGEDGAFGIGGNTVMEKHGGGGGSYGDGGTSAYSSSDDYAGAPGTFGGGGSGGGYAGGGGDGGNGIVIIEWGAKIS